MALLTVLMCFVAANAFAQLKEVRGVQTRVVEYKSDETYVYIKYKRHGFEFKNENNYDVWVEAELVTQGYSYGMTEIVSGTRDAKSFTLKAGEAYIWKCGDKMLLNEHDYYDKFYVTYKAYKAE